MDIRLVIFDLDGTLVDTIEDLTASLNHAIAFIGLPPLTPDETKALVGEGVRNLIERAVGPAHLGHADEVLARFRAHYTEHIADRSRLYPGVVETLDALGHMRLAVLSNKSEAMSRLLLEKLGIAGRFAMIAGGDTVPVKKPSPAAVRYVLDALGVSETEALLVGDSGYDVDAGRAAGVRVVAVSYGYRPRQTLEHADWIIDSMSELPGVVRELNTAS